MKRYVAVVVAVMVLTAASAFAGNVQDARKEMNTLHQKQAEERLAFEKALKELDASTKEELSKLQKGDRAGRLKIKQEKKLKLEELLENFRKQADARRDERERIKGKLRTGSGS